MRSRERPASDVFLFPLPLYWAGACLLKLRMRLTICGQLWRQALISGLCWSSPWPSNFEGSLRMLVIDWKPRIEAASSMLTRDIGISDGCLGLEYYEILLCPLGSASSICFRLLCRNILCWCVSHRIKWTTSAHESQRISSFPSTSLSCLPSISSQHFPAQRVSFATNLFCFFLGHFSSIQSL